MKFQNYAMLHKVFIFAVVVFTLTTSGQVQAKTLSWVYSSLSQDTQGEEQGGTLSYSMNSDITQIEDEKEIITIHFSDAVLYRYDKRSDICVAFPIASPAPAQLNSQKKKTLLQSNFRLFSTDKYTKTASYACRVKRILFGADFARFQTLVPSATSEFGQEFTESMVSYCVSQDIVAFDTLFKISQKHNALYTRNPFLRQIDLAGLFEVLGGFPVQIIKKVDTITTTLALIEEPEPKDNIILPQKCVN